MRERGVERRKKGKEGGRKGEKDTHRKKIGKHYMCVKTHRTLEHKE